ncbi:MAG: sigma 54-interacting transcriptional regulator [Polyangiales bacterium]|nr:sigma 54-dependent Fis family transcriptional regulator [Sandaracinus sp.]
MPPKNTLPWNEDAAHATVDTLRVIVRDGPAVGATRTADGEVLSVGSAEGNDLVIDDPTVSRFHVELRHTTQGVRVRDTGSTNGVFAGGIRLTDAVVPFGTVLRLGRTNLEILEGEPREIDVHAADSLGALHGRSEGMRRLMSQIERAARTEASVLIVGESGTGKELIARSLHELGPRSPKPFVVVDCGALAPNLVASELFGHERGSFTGAERQHVGAFERAHGGTLFLDEIGELPPELQPMLLGALERRRFRRVGGSKDIEVDVRVVAATHRDLRAEVNDGHFRLDLYYRLAVVPLRVPSLRERLEDLELLVTHFLGELGRHTPIDDLFPPSVLASLRTHRWPGNVRELRNVVEATVAMGEPMVEHLSQPPPGQEVSGDAIAMGPLYPLSYKDARAALLHEFEHRYIKHWLACTQGNVAHAAREAKMDRSHLFHLLRRHDLRAES